MSFTVRNLIPRHLKSRKNEIWIIYCPVFEWPYHSKTRCHSKSGHSCLVTSLVTSFQMHPKSGPHFGILDSHSKVRLKWMSFSYTIEMGHSETRHTFRQVWYSDPLRKQWGSEIHPFEIQNPDFLKIGPQMVFFCWFAT